MRQDQFERLHSLEEKLTDVLLKEAEPDKWPGHGIEPGAMDKSTRGDRYWCKKNAVATISLIQRVGSLIGAVRLRGDGTLPPAGPPAETEDEGEEAQQDSMEEEVLAYEKEAAKLLRDMQADSKKAATDKRQNGRKAG